jgi:hypothetical protein
MTRTHVLQGIVIMALGVTGYVAPGHSTPTAAPTTVTPSSPPETEHSRPVPVTIRLQVDASVARGASEELMLSVDLDNTTDKAMRSTFAFEVVSDRGVVVRRPALQPLLTLAGKASESRATAGIPAGLPDGFYFAKATVAWKGEADSGTAADYLYFHVNAGRIAVMDANEWHTLSAANEGVILP